MRKILILPMVIILTMIFLAACDGTGGGSNVGKTTNTGSGVKLSEKDAESADELKKISDYQCR